jgi:plastocyanin
MRHFNLIPPPARPAARRRWAAPLILVAALCGLVVTDVRPSFGGTVVRGRLVLPTTARAKSTTGRPVREVIDALDAVIYVTVAPGENPRKLNGRARGREIELQGDRFLPRVLPVMAGSKVRFRNGDRVYHRVFSVSPTGRFDLGNLGPGQKGEHRFESPGFVHLFCELHPAAAGFIVVRPDWFFAMAGPGGEYALPGLPRGAYLIHAWHPRLGSTQRLVRVTGGGAYDLDLRL